MHTVGSKDLRRVLDLVYALNSEPTGPGTAPPVEVLAELGRLVGADVTAYTRVDHRSERLVAAAVVPAEQNISGSSDFHAVFDQHPGLAAYRSGKLMLGSPIALSDLAAPAELRRLPLFVDFYAARGTLDQLMCLVSLDPRYGTNLTFNRSRRGFSARDRAILELIAPHVAQAMDRNARLAELAASARLLERHVNDLAAARAALPGLTPAERTVCDRLAGGLTDREIARSLAISPRTVHKHLQNVYRKLGVTNRTSLMALLQAAA
ncbi:helix-turn-helix transcriptional regulator [Pseudonocardia acaciae]|uniref:helix-turn-helix transcriptional regulator n=1 Tax=Pseudonocardia acaciae TaxID=551276 RepID=UPI0006858C02|nr:LuxR C-terminal-related transcriptional regulator [Pseudonocardia acaciae]